MAVGSPIRANGVAKSASFSCPGTPEIGPMSNPDGAPTDTDVSSVASSAPGDIGDGGESRRSSDQPVQILKEVEVVPPVLSSRSEEYRQLFRLPSEEVLVQDFNCALQENILLQGHMYLFVHYICFYSNIFGFETKKIIPFNEVSSVQKAKTVGVFPNAVEIVAGEKKYFFASFLSLDKQYRLIIDGWTHCNDNPNPKYFFASFLSRDEAYRLIVDGWTHSNNNAKYLIDCQDAKSETGSVENKLDLLDRLKSLRRPGIFDVNPLDRNKEEIVEGPQHACNGVEEINGESTNGKLISFQENRGGMKEGSVQSEVVPPGTLAWNPEDADAPKIPEHYKMVAESKFPIHPEVFFKLFFSDSSFDFCEAFHKRCGDKNFQCDHWYKNEESGCTREVLFQHPIKLYLGARFARCREIQKLRVYKNSHMVVQVTQLMNDAPYSDYFTVEGLWDVECNENEGNGCILRVYMNVAFSRKTMFRGKIEQATTEECREAYATWINCAHELLKKDNNLKVLGNVSSGKESIQQEIGCAKRSLPSELVDGSDEVLSPRFKRSRDEADRSSVVALLTESFNSFYAYLRNQSNFTWLSVAVFVYILLIFQLIIIFLLMRGSRVNVHQDSFYPSIPGGNRAEAISWLERRLHFLKEEMLMVESRLDNMRHEYSSLKAHLQRLERLWPKS